MKVIKPVYMVYIILLHASFLSALPDFADVRTALLEAKRLEDQSVPIINGSGNLLEAEDLAVRFDNLLQSLQLNIGAFSDNDLTIEENVALHRELTRVARVLGRTRERLRAVIDSWRSAYRAPFIKDGSMGRPRLQIMEDQLLMFQRLGFTWTAMSRMLGVSIRTVWRRVQEFGIDSRGRYTFLTDDEVDELVQQIKSRLPDAVGTGTVLGHMAARGIVLPNGHLRVYQSLVRLDALATSRRWNPVTTRRTYWVPGPGSLWHIDGNHKLIRWGIVIHGGIDGYSRFITFLQASDNNYAQTVAIGFTEATRRHGLPSRIRTDRGGENVIIGDIMESIRGQGRGSWLRGPSVHNQRIERLWRDVRCFCSNFFIDLFYRMEEMSILIPGSTIHRFSLHYVFLARLNIALREFSQAYNYHRMRTMNNRSPYQIYIAGLMSRYNSNYLHVRELINSSAHDISLADFGIEARSVGNEDEESVINVLRPSLDLNALDYNILMERLHRLVPDVNAECDDNGVAFYMLVLVCVDRFINSL